MSDGVSATPEDRLRRENTASERHSSRRVPLLSRRDIYSIDDMDAFQCSLEVMLVRAHVHITEGFEPNGGFKQFVEFSAILRLTRREE